MVAGTMPRCRSFSWTRGRNLRSKPGSSIRDQVTRRRCRSPSRRLHYRDLILHHREHGAHGKARKCFSPQRHRDTEFLGFLFIASWNDFRILLSLCLRVSSGNRFPCFSVRSVFSVVKTSKSLCLCGGINSFSPTRSPAACSPTSCATRRQPEQTLGTWPANLRRCHRCVRGATATPAQIDRAPSPPPPLSLCPPDTTPPAAIHRRGFGALDDGWNLPA